MSDTYLKQQARLYGAVCLKMYTVMSVQYFESITWMKLPCYILPRWKKILPILAHTTHYECLQSKHRIHLKYITQWIEDNITLSTSYRSASTLDTVGIRFLLHFCSQNLLIEINLVSSFCSCLKKCIQITAYNCVLQGLQ